LFSLPLKTVGPGDPRNLIYSRALGLAEFVHSGLLGAIVI
jgi:hypothetical protein